ncbi:MAG: type I-C CRISPR-associated endonuclease Cas1 [Lachnospiraceae bacterium]|mgnify:FL=1|jgi:CRISPR-associated protein Cas1|nr:type I-C CRISPR-associated endonuclease Cas1 [Lachnospiraceae bacterium]
MRQLLNMLFVTKPDVYLGLNGENITVRENDKIIARYPLHNLEGIVSFSNLGISSQLMEKCVSQNISICFLTPTGRFRARVIGETRGNVLLRKKQYQIADQKDTCLEIACNFILGKVYNEKWLLERYIRQYPMRVPMEEMKKASLSLSDYMHEIQGSENMDQLRGFEGSAQVVYFSEFDHMIMNQKEAFYFNGRNKRPPEDRVNSLLSFAYTLLANDITAALETVGLDPYIGFMHQDRPGRASLANDLIEELRAPIGDRFVLSLINRKQLHADDFEINENKSVYIKEAARRTFISEWQKKKQEELTHPFLGEKMSWGLVPYAQALLLARYLRGDLDQYPPFFWK